MFFVDNIQPQIQLLYRVIPKHIHVPTSWEIIASNSKGVGWNYKQYIWKEIRNLISEIYSGLWEWGRGRNQAKKLSGGRYSGISIFQISKGNKS